MRCHDPSRQITSIVLGVIYHSTSNREPENVILRQHIQRNLDMLLSDQPNALVIVTDFNHHTTGLKSKHISQANHLKQLVTFKTKDWTGCLQIDQSCSVYRNCPKSHHLIIIPS